MMGVGDFSNRRERSRAGVSGNLMRQDGGEDTAGPQRPHPAGEKPQPQASLEAERVQNVKTEGEVPSVFPSPVTFLYEFILTK